MISNFITPALLISVAQVGIIITAPNVVYW